MEINCRLLPHAEVKSNQNFDLPSQKRINLRTSVIFASQIEWQTLQFKRYFLLSIETNVSVKDHGKWSLRHSTGIQGTQLFWLSVSILVRLQFIVLNQLTFPVNQSVSCYKEINCFMAALNRRNSLSGSLV